MRASSDTSIVGEGCLRSSSGIARRGKDALEECRLSPPQDDQAAAQVRCGTELPHDRPRVPEDILGSDQPENHRPSWQALLPRGNGRPLPAPYSGGNKGASSTPGSAVRIFLGQ